MVTVADDGGSTSRLRSELGIVAPGDIRNCLVALADSEEVMQQLMDYRFESEGELNGYSFGNILIAALAGIGGDFNRGVEIAGELLAIRGRVVPSTSSLSPAPSLHLTRWLRARPHELLHDFLRSQPTPPNSCFNEP